MNTKKDTVLITGSEGSLMQAVIPKLVGKYNVVGVDSLERHGKRVCSLYSTDDYTFIKLDLTDSDYVFKLFNEYRPRYVIQAAAKIYGIGGFNKYCADILGDDVALHINILKNAKRFHTERVVYISSSMVYEQVFQAIPVNENLINGNLVEHVPQTDYGLSKFVCERLSQSFKNQYNLEYTFWRPFNIITPFEFAGNQDIGISHVFADFIRNIIEYKLNPLPILGDGKQIRCFTWIEDVAEAIAKFSFDERTKNEAFNLGNHEPITMMDLATRIYKEYRKQLHNGRYEELVFKPSDGYTNDVKVRIPNVIKAKNVLEWEATHDVNYSINRCVKEYIKHMKW